MARSRRPRREHAELCAKLRTHDTVVVPHSCHSGSNSVVQADGLGPQDGPDLRFHLMTRVSGSCRISFPS